MSRAFIRLSRRVIPVVPGLIRGVPRDERAVLPRDQAVRRCERTVPNCDPAVPTLSRRITGAEEGATPSIRTRLTTEGVTLHMTPVSSRDSTDEKQRPDPTDPYGCEGRRRPESCCRTRIREPKVTPDPPFPYEMTVLPSPIPTTVAGTRAERVNPAFGKSPSSR